MIEDEWAQRVIQGRAVHSPTRTQPHKIQTRWAEPSNGYRAPDMVRDEPRVSSHKQQETEGMSEVHPRGRNGNSSPELFLD